MHNTLIGTLQPLTLSSMGYSLYASSDREECFYYDQTVIVLTQLSCKKGREATTKGGAKHDPVGCTCFLRKCDWI